MQNFSEYKNCFAKHCHPQVSLQTACEVPVPDSNLTRMIPALAISNTASRVWYCEHHLKNYTLASYILFLDIICCRKRTLPCQ